MLWHITANSFNECEISGFLTGDKEYCLLVYNAMRYGRNSIFRGEDGDRKIL
jgi:hypothetical protein